jgi:hypothetical protein
MSFNNVGKFLYNPFYSLASEFLIQQYFQKLSQTEPLDGESKRIERKNESANLNFKR